MTHFCFCLRFFGSIWRKQTYRQSETQFKTILEQSWATQLKKVSNSIQFIERKVQFNSIQFGDLWQLFSTQFDSIHRHCKLYSIQFISIHQFGKLFSTQLNTIHQLYQICPIQFMSTQKLNWVELDVFWIELPSSGRQN